MLLRYRLLATAFIAAASAFARADNGLPNIMITGYWPETNNMVRQFSTNPDQNPDGWVGGNWEGRGYNIHSFFPEFPNGVGQGVGDFEVDYQDTSSDWWRITEQVKPIAIITFSRGDVGWNWEVEQKQRNLDQWVDDYTEPYQPTPAPPDPDYPVNGVRESTLPMQDIVDAVNTTTPVIDAFIDQDGFGGGFLSEFIAYHGVWYQALHADPSDPAWCVAAGHIHVGANTRLGAATKATEATLRVLTDYLDTIVPEPSSLLAIAVLLPLIRRR